MSLLPTGFPFEFQQNHVQKDSHSRISKPAIQKKVNKRKMTDTDHQEDECAFSSAPRSKYSIKPVHFKYTKNKKQRNPVVLGQKLSLSRIVETLDKESLQALVSNLVVEHPEVAESMIKLAPKVTIEDSMQILSEKLQRILDSLPYKVDPASDYAFLRVKSQMEDFFQTLSDYTLNFLPPVETDLTVSLSFLIEFLMKHFNRLPKFQTVEFRYYYRLTIEKFNTIFTDVIGQFLSEKRQNILLAINKDWLADIKRINDLNNNDFADVYALLKHEIDQYYNGSNGVETGSSSGLEATGGTTANRLMGLGGLLNFSTDNNPLHGNTVGNVYDAI